MPMTQEDRNLAKFVYDALLGYAPKRLIACDLTDKNGDHCALGVANAADPNRYTRLLAKGCTGLAFIWEENDNFAGTPEERYAHMKAYLEGMLGLTRMEPLPQEEKELVNV